MLKHIDWSQVATIVVAAVIITVMKIWNVKPMIYLITAALANWGQTAQKLAIWFPGRMKLDLNWKSQ